MNERPTYVYRLEVEYPPNSRWPWKPEGWEDPYGDPDSPGFQWPAVRRYLSRSGAYRRARLLESYGATVTVHRSEPVVWCEAVRDR